MTLTSDSDTTLPMQVSTPCVKTLAVKVLAVCWCSDYSRLKAMAEQALAENDVLDPAFLREFAGASARKQAADSVLFLIGRRMDCGAEIFLPLLHLRCQKEILTLQSRLDTPPQGVESEYFSSSLYAWERIAGIIAE